MEQKRGVWSDHDGTCFNCLCNIPHTWGQHAATVEQEIATLREEIAMMEREFGDWDDPGWSRAQRKRARTSRF